jgi:hypothetical protein
VVSELLERAVLDALQEQAQGTLHLPPTRSHAVFAAGIEYGVDHASGQSSNVLIEGTYVAGIPRARAEQLNPFQADVFLGYRLSFNDAALRRVLVAAVIDVERFDEVLVHASYDQQLGDVWELGAHAWFFFVPSPSRASVFGYLKRADHLALSLTRFF